MARQAHIVSFEDAKAASRALRAQGGSSRMSRNASGGHSPSRTSGGIASRNGEDDSTTARRGASSRAQSRAAISRASSQQGTPRSRSGAVGSKSRSASAGSRATRATSSASNSRQRAAGATKAASSAANARHNAEEFRKSPASRRDERRRSRQKERAGRLFDRQYAHEAARAEASAEGAPRAALYEGQMGPSHRRTARMQRASQASPVSAKVNPVGWFAHLNVSPRAMKAFTAALCLVLVCVFLYAPAQQYYQSLREHDRLQAEYAVLEERNQVLDEQNDALASDAGMEDAARQKYGYVVSGDQTAVVTGLSEEAVASARNGDNVQANVLASSVKAPEGWYTPYLDAFFGVSQ